MQVEGEVQALLARRDFLESDVDHLEQYLVAQRERIIEAVAALTDLVQRVPGGLADMRRPLLSAAAEPPVGDRRWGCRRARASTTTTRSPSRTPRRSERSEIAEITKVAEAGSTSDDVAAVGVRSAVRRGRRADRTARRRQSPRALNGAGR